MAITTTRTERIDVRVSSKHKEKLEQAANLLGLTLSSFMVEQALRAAMNTIEKAAHLELSEKDWKIMTKALENPPVPNTSLVQAVKAYKKRA